MSLNYSNREIDLMFNEIKIILADQNKVLSSIENKVSATNGRVRLLEKWKWAMMGAISILGWLFAQNFIHCLGVACKIALV